MDQHVNTVVGFACLLGVLVGGAALYQLGKHMVRHDLATAALKDNYRARPALWRDWRATGGRVLGSLLLVVVIVGVLVVYATSGATGR